MFTISPINLYQLSINVDTMGIKEDKSNLIDTQAIESLVSKQVIINQDYKEENNILERKKVIFERKNSWIKMKNRKHIQKSTNPKCSNATLKLVGNRRSSRTSSVKGTDTSLVRKTCSKSKAEMSTPTGPNEAIQVNCEPDKEQLGELIDNHQRVQMKVGTSPQRIEVIKYSSQE